METVKETVIDSTDIKQQIVQQIVREIVREIDLIPDDQLAGLYQFIRYFRLGVQVASNGAMVSDNGFHPEFLNHQGEPEIAEDGNDSTIDRDEDKTSSGERILSFAGAWSDMPDEEFDDFLNEIYSRRRGEHFSEHLVVEA